MIQSQQEEFQKALDWCGAGTDSERTVESPVRSREVVVLVHRIRRLSACSQKELSQQWHDRIPVDRITTLTYREGDLDYVVDRADEGVLPDWVQSRPWCGQSVFTFWVSDPAELLPPDVDCSYTFSDSSVLMNGEVFHSGAPDLESPGGAGRCVMLSRRQAFATDACLSQ